MPVRTPVGRAVGYSLSESLYFIFAKARIFGWKRSDEFSVAVLLIEPVRYEHATIRTSLLKPSRSEVPYAARGYLAEVSVFELLVAHIAHVLFRKRGVVKKIARGFAKYHRRPTSRGALGSGSRWAGRSSCPLPTTLSPRRICSAARLSC